MSARNRDSMRFFMVITPFESAPSRKVSFCCLSLSSRATAQGEAGGSFRRIHKICGHHNQIVEVRFIKVFTLKNTSKNRTESIAQMFNRTIHRNCSIHQ